MGVIEKINAEMQEKPDDKYREIIGHYIIDRCEDPACAEKVTADKTLKGAMEAILSFAKKNKSGYVAVLDDSTVFRKVDEYFGFPEYRTLQRKALEPEGLEAGKTRVALSLADFL